MATNKTIDKILKSTGNKYGAAIKDSDSMERETLFSTDIPILNVALSGDIDDGMSPGLLQLVGESKTFKTLYMLLMAKAYMDKYPDAVLAFFDSELGADMSYFDSIGIDTDRVVHLPFESVEDLRIQLAKLLKDTASGDHIFIAVDSIGLPPSEKEVTDAEDGKTTADMSRARALNSLFRIVGIQLGLKKLPMVVVNHAYDQIGTMYPQKIVKGGKVSYLLSDEIFMISRAQEKSAGELEGYTFTLTIEKSRKVKEKSKFPITVLFNGGIDEYSGLLEIAVESGHIEKPSNGWYQLKGVEQKVRASATGPLLDIVMKDETFKTFVKQKYKLVTGQLVKSKPKGE